MLFKVHVDHTYDLQDYARQVGQQDIIQYLPARFYLRLPSRHIPVSAGAIIPQ